GDHPALHQWDPPSALLSFNLKGKTPVIVVQTDRTELKLTVDSGAEINLMDEKYELELGEPINGQEKRTFGGIATKARQVSLKNVSSIKVSGLSTGPMKTAFVNLHDFNHKVKGPMVDGILGAEFLACFRVAFNFKKRELYLWEGVGGLMVEGR
ncbi:MAG: aspartyl protease family protein, partial [Sinomicrobium sp.]|nr:aspartyl protease family protein [Sinomicrobium sp.]